MNRWVAPFLCLALSFVLPGCPGPEGTDAGSDTPVIVDAGRDAAADAGRMDGGPLDAPALDAPVDAPVNMDAPPDLDAPTDAPTAVDAPAELDAPAIDAPSVPTDTGVDAPIDAGVVAPTDAGTDAPTCSMDGDCPAALTCLPTMSCGCPARLEPTPDAMGRTPDIILSEIVPGAGGYIELYNTTSSAITLPGPYWLCSPFAYAMLGTGTIPARGYLTIPWPASFSDTLAGGEVILYSSDVFGSASAVMDFVCWGTNPHGTRQALAFSASRWSASTGGCAPPITGGAIHRRALTDGVDAADYDTTSRPSGVSCTP
jgi:hypothetical protein